MRLAQRSVADAAFGGGHFEGAVGHGLSRSDWLEPRR
jgi:hypothetical protein